MHKLLLYSFLLFICILSLNFCKAQLVNDSLLRRISYRFAQEGYTLDTTIKSPKPGKNNLPPAQPYSCYKNKEMFVVAIYSSKPVKPYGRMLVIKKFRQGTKYDEHFFGEIMYDKPLNINYTAISVLFPLEVTSQNCGIELQVYDKGNATNTVWLLIFSR